MAQDLGISERRCRAVGYHYGVRGDVCQPVYHLNYPRYRSPLRGDPVFSSADPFLPVGLVCQQLFVIAAGLRVPGLALGGFGRCRRRSPCGWCRCAWCPKALSVIFGAVSIALVIAAPLGSFLGGIIGWRNVFNGAAVMGVICAIWVLKALPSLPGESTSAQQTCSAC